MGRVLDRRASFRLCGTTRLLFYCDGTGREKGDWSIDLNEKGEFEARGVDAWSIIEAKMNHVERKP